MPSDEPAAAAAEEVVGESVSHYKVEKLGDGRVRLSSGGRVVIAETYYEALERFAAWQQERIEELPEHLREDKLKSISHDSTNPELADVLPNDADWIREEVLDDVRSGETDVSASGAWLARVDETDIPDLGDRINLYRLWNTVYEDREDGDD